MYITAPIEFLRPTRLPFGERGTIFAKVCGLFWESDVTVNVTGSVTGSASPEVDGTDVVYNVGGNLYFSGNFALRVEWECYALDHNDVDFLSASLLFRFGGSGK